MTATPIPPDFAHLHVHSHFTLLGATAAPDELARQAAAHGLTALALTDSDALYWEVELEVLQEITIIRRQFAAVRDDGALDGSGQGQLRERCAIIGRGQRRDELSQHTAEVL